MPKKPNKAALGMDSPFDRFSERDKNQKRYTETRDKDVHLSYSGSEKDELEVGADKRGDWLNDYMLRACRWAEFSKIGADSLKDTCIRLDWYLRNRVNRRRLDAAALGDRNAEVDIQQLILRTFPADIGYLAAPVQIARDLIRCIQARSGFDGMWPSPRPLLLLPNSITADLASSSLSHFPDLHCIRIPSDLNFDPSKLSPFPGTITTLFISEDSEPYCRRHAHDQVDVIIRLRRDFKPGFTLEFPARSAPMLDKIDHLFPRQASLLFGGHAEARTTL